MDKNKFFFTIKKCYGNLYIFVYVCVCDWYVTTFAFLPNQVTQGDTGGHL